MASGDYHVNVVVKSFLANYWQAAMQGVAQEAEGLNVSYEALQRASGAGIPLATFSDVAESEAPDPILPPW